MEKELAYIGKRSATPRARLLQLSAAQK